jgi:6-phosphogluconolactonase
MSSTAATVAHRLCALGVGVAVALSVASCHADAGRPDAAAPDVDLAISDQSSTTSDLATPSDLAPAGIPFVYVSGYAPQIVRYRFDLATGALTSAGTTTVSGEPSFLAVDVPRRHLYAVDEQTSGQVRAFSIDPITGALTALNTVSSGGMGPAHVAVDASGAWVLATNYGDGVVTVLPVQADGSLGVAADAQMLGVNAHQALVDPNGVVYVPCKGSDYVAQRKLDVTGHLAALTPAQVTTAMGAGPRHLALHPNGAYAYLIDELDSTMTAWSRDAEGRLTAMQTVSTRAAGKSGANIAAEVQVHPSGQWLYGSNRGDDDLARWSLDASGHMTPIDHTPSGGQTPRMFTIDPSGRYLLVANQDSGNVVVFAIDQTSGALSAMGITISYPMAAFVAVAYL